jgi:hypothetical protein
MTTDAYRKPGGEGEPAMRRLPSELAAQLDRILAAGERMVALVPDRLMDREGQRTSGTVRDVTYRLFRQSLAFADAMDMGRLPAEWRSDRVPRDLVDGGAVARYGALVRARLSGWFEGAGSAEYSRTIETDRGLQPGHALLEHTTTEAAQQLRRLHALLEDLGLRPDEPLPDGLP